jgi:hypothetical protein
MADVSLVFPAPSVVEWDAVPFSSRVPPASGEKVPFYPIESEDFSLTRVFPFLADSSAASLQLSNPPQLSLSSCLNSSLLVLGKMEPQELPS